jgi:hypothetical protein
MQKTEVFDIINIFLGALWANFGRIWPFLGLKSGVKFFGLIFLYHYLFGAISADFCHLWAYKVGSIFFG